MSFNISSSQDTLVSKIAKLDPFILGLHPNAQSLEGRAEYIKALCKLVAEHVEECMADADANQSFARIGDEDAAALSDMGADLAAQVMRAADAMTEEFA